jgi:hypothetical protein
MKKITLLLTAMLFSIITYAQVFPTLSNEGVDTWYYIQFERPGNGNNGVIQDMGEGVKLLTKQARENTDSQLWKVTGSVGNYVIINKLGRTIDHNGSKFTATTGSTVAFAIDLDNNATYEAYELQRVGDTDYMNQDGGPGFEKELGQWVYGDDNNSLNFRLPADVIGGLETALTATLPTEGVSYHIKFRDGNGVLKDMGDGNLLKTSMPIEGDVTQLWKVSGTAGDYTLTSGSGNIIDWDGTNFTTSATSTTKIALIENLPGWELQRVGSTDAMNQNGGRGYGKDLGEYTVGDGGNPLNFVLPGSIAYGPKLSGVDGNDYWYTIKFGAGDAVIEDKGDDTVLLTALEVGTDIQLWKTTGTEDALTFTNKSTGRTISFASSRITASSTGSVTFKVISNDDGSFFNLQRDGSTDGINQFGGAGVDKELGEWRINDTNNLLVFNSSTTLGINTISDNNTISAYPNPFKNYFHFNVKNSSSNEASLKVYSISGKLVKSNSLSLNNGDVTVDASSLSKGLYIVEIETAKGKSNFKMIKQ